MRGYDFTTARIVSTLRRTLALTLVCVIVCATSFTAFAQGSPPKINPVEANKLGTLPYNADIQSRLTFISGLYRQMPRLFEESAKYDFDMLQILTDQATLMSTLNATPEYRNALQNRTPLSQVTVVPVGNQGNRTRVPVRGELPQEAIEEFQTRLIAAAEAMDAELARTKGTWSANGITELIKADLARLDPSKTNPGAIVAALQSLLSPSEKKEAGAIKDFTAKIEYLARHVDPDKVKDPALFDPARLKLSSVFSTTPTLEELIRYSTEYTKVKEGLGDRLALYAELNATPGSEASKAALLENLRKLNKEQLVYLSDEADVLRPIFEKVSADASVRGSLIKNVASSLGGVFDRAPTTMIELSPVLLAEQPWWYGILRGFVSGDCSSQHSFAYPNDPGERTFFVSEPGSPGDYKGIVTASSVMKGGKRSLYVITIHGSRISPADVYSILYGLDQIKGQLGFDAIELPTSENLYGLVNRGDLRLAMDSIASKGALGAISYQNDSVRAAIEGLQSEYNRADYDSRAKNSQSRTFVPDAQVVKGLNASNAWGTLQTVDTSLPSKATAIQMFHDLLYAKRFAVAADMDAFQAELRAVGEKWGINVDDVVSLMDAVKNPKGTPLKAFELDLNQRLTKLLDAQSSLPRGADTAQSLLDSRLDWVREGYSKVPDLLKPENSASAAKVLKSFVSDLKVALKESKVPSYLFNNPELLTAEPILSTLARDGIIQDKLIGRGQDLLAQSYRALLTGKAQEIGSYGTRVNDLILGYSDHRGDSLSSGLKKPTAPLSEGPVRSAVVDILNRYEISLMQRTQSITGLENDIKINGRNEAFWKGFREAVRMWDTTPLPEGVARYKIVETAVFKFGPLFDPNYMSLLPTIHGASSEGPGRVAGFLSKQKNIPASVLDWYVDGFLHDPNKFSVIGFASSQVPAAVWNKVQTLPVSESRPFLAGQEKWPQSTLDWFLSKFNEATIGQELEWKLLSLLYDRNQVPLAEMARIEGLISRYTAEAAVNFAWDSDVLPPKMQEAFLREATERPSDASLKVVKEYVNDIPKALFDKMVDYLTKAPSKELGWSAVEFLRDTVSLWPESVKLKLISAAAPAQGSAGWWPDGNLGKLFGQLSGDPFAIKMNDTSSPTFSTLLSEALEHRPGEMVGKDSLYGEQGFFQHDRRRVNLNAATLKAILNGQLSGIPDAFAVLPAEGAALPNSGITFELVPLKGMIRTEANGAEIISAADLILSFLEGRANKAGWSVDPRNPASVGDMAVLSEYYAEFSLEPDTEGAKLLQELRTVVQQNLKAPTRPGEVVVRGGAAFTKAVTDVVTKYGGEVYTGEGGRTRVVASDGSVIEFPNLETRDYVRVIGDRVAFIEVVGGTATGAAATSLANQVPADVQAEFNKLNPIAGNEFVEEGVNQVADRMAEAGKPPQIGGLPIEGITEGQLAVGKRTSFENLRDAYHEAGNEAKLKAYEMVDSVTKWRQGFGVAGMIGSFVVLETANTIFDQQINAIAAGNWDAFDDSYKYAVGKLPESILHTTAGIAVFEGAGIGAGALSAAGASLTAGGSPILGGAAAGLGTAGTAALTLGGVAFMAAAVATELNEIGKTATLMDHLDEQAAKVGMQDDSWAYSDNAFYRQVELEAEVGTHLIGDAWNSIADPIKKAFNEMVMKGLGSPDGKVWAFDSSFENGDIGGDTSKPNPFPPSEAANDWLDASAQAGNGGDAPVDEPMMKIPGWLEDLAEKGSFAGKALSGILHTVHDVFPSLVGAPTSRGADVLRAPAQKPSTTSETSRLPGTIERMEDAIRRANQKEGNTQPPTDDIRFDDLVAELGTDPQAWSEAFEAGLLSMSDIERVFGRMKAAEPEDPNAPPPPQLVKGPVNTVVAKGQSITLSAQATGQNLYYVWALDGEPLAGFVGATISIPNADFDDAGSYVVYVSDGKSMVASAPAQVAVVGFVAQPPQASAGVAGKSFSLTAQLSAGNATYQWMKNGAPVAGATTPTLSFASLKSTDVGTYTLAAKIGSITVTSDPAAVNVLEFAKEPELRVATIGSRATLTASGKVTLASGGAGAVTYQWLKNGVAIPSQTSPVLTFATAQKSDTGNYTVKITHESGAAESAPGHLEIIDRAQSASSLTMSPAFSCTIPQLTGGALSCKETVGANQWGESTPGNIIGATAVALGVRHGCAINALSKVSCWGDKSAGQTTPPADLTGAVALALGSTYSCALLNTGLVKCWGSGIVSPGVNQVIALESSGAGTCAKTLSGDRVCWGP